ncbi:MAG TPA: SIS domain-containing protein [Phycisphaerae bacterium]|nr:SIS domain-containing protein [Phycisphaerae bacterium]
MATDDAALANLAASDPEAARVLADFADRNESLRQAIVPMARAVELIVDAVRKGRIVFLCGNGGSFADAMHIKGELGKSFERARPLHDEAVLARLADLPMGEQLGEHLEVGIPAVVLGESHALATAYANDRDPILVMAQELLGFICRGGGGVLMGLSTSGESRNVVAAMSLARAYAIPVIALTGPRSSLMGDVADVLIQAPGASTAQVQENHLCVYHALCLAIEASLFDGGKL